MKVLEQRLVFEEDMNKVVLEENNIKSLEQPMRVEMAKSITHFEHELTKIRTGRAHTSLIEDVQILCYGSQMMPLKSVASLAAPEARLLTIQPWDKGNVAVIMKAITDSGLGLTPIQNGDVIRIQLPEMTSTRREELVKILGKKLEECKVSIRNVRKDFQNVIRDSKTDKTISENFYNRLMDVLQEVTDHFCKQADQLAKKKQDDITSI